MPTKLDSIRRVADNHILRRDINWADLPRDVGDAAVVRGDPFVRREFIQEVIDDIRAGKIAAKSVFPNGTPSMLEIYNLAAARQRGSRTSMPSLHRMQLEQAKALRRSRARRLGHKPLL